MLDVLDESLPIQVYWNKDKCPIQKRAEEFTLPTRRKNQ
jgi:hypothetical protein